MTDTNEQLATSPLAPSLRPPASGRVRLASSLGWLFWLSVGWLALLGLAALLAPILGLPDPNSISSGVFAGPSLRHILGTDDLGRDVFARLIYGARVSLAIGLGSSALALLVGGSLGLVAGYVKGTTDLALSTLTNILLSFPALVFLLAVVAFIGPHLGVIIVAIGILGIAPMFRVVRSATLSVAEREFVRSAASIGAGHLRILLKEIVPNVAPTVLAFSLVSVATAILVESGLAFLGLSVAPPTATWGGMVAEGLQYLSKDAWISLWPSLMLLITLLAFNFAGDRLHSALDARSGRA